MGEDDARLFIEYVEETAHQTRGDLATKADIKTEIAETKANLIRWMFLFWIGQVAVLFGLIKLLGTPA